MTNLNCFILKLGITGDWDQVLGEIFSPWDYPRYYTHNVLTVQWYEKLMKFLFMEHTKKVLEKNEWFLESTNNALFAVNSVCSWWGPENIKKQFSCRNHKCLLVSHVWLTTLNCQTEDFLTRAKSWSVHQDHLNSVLRLVQICNWVWWIDGIFKADINIGKLPKSLRWLLLINEISDMKANLD